MPGLAAVFHFGNTGLEIHKDNKTSLLHRASDNAQKDNEKNGNQTCDTTLCGGEYKLLVGNIVYNKVHSKNVIQ